MAVNQLLKRFLNSNNKRTVWGVCLLLALAVFAVFGQTLRHPFINFDDHQYVYANPQIAQGLTLPGIAWAFTHSYSANWHPLTWLSHMLDCQIWGLNAGGHHLTNVLLHAANAVLLFLVLRRMMGLHADESAGAAATPAGALWPSAFVAAVFAIHPLHVESVAWVAERKDVLSGLFFLLTLGAYARYAQCVTSNQPSPRFGTAGRWQVTRAEGVTPVPDPSPVTRHPSLFYGLTLLFFALGLMSKPMLVTLPFVLLLLDWWPLQRVSSFKFQVSNLRLIWEKIPFFALSATACVVTVFVQKSFVASTEALSLPLRFSNALVSYVAYLGQMFCPARLTILYPFPRNGLPLLEVTLALVLLTGISAMVFALWRRCPYLPVGWLWYLGMLVPVIGLVQVGDQSHADRYTYLPQIGLYLMVAWAVRDLTASWRYRRPVLGAGAMVVIAALMVCAWKQTSYWRDSETLWRHTLACTSKNDIACNNLGNTVAEQGRFAEAIEYLQRAIEINPAYAQAHNNLAAVLVKQGRSAEAIGHYQKAIALNPDLAEAHHNLGALFSSQGRLDEAVEQYQNAIELNPNSAEAHYGLAGVFGLRNQLEEAIEHYRKAIEIKPDYVDAHGNLANALAAQGRLDEALKEYQRTLELAPHSAQARFRFGQALQDQKRFAAAMAQYQKALELDPRHLLAHLNLAWLLATCPEASLRDGRRAVALARQAEQLANQGESPRIFDTLAAAYAEAGQFDEAVETARRALKLNATQNNQPLAEAIQSRLKLYETNSPYHEKL